MQMNTDSRQRYLSLAEIRRRVAQTPVSMAMVRNMVKTINQQSREIACLKNKLGC
jgi:hypothetical protein